MSDFILQKENEKINSINRTIRFSPETFERITDLSTKTGISFNKIVNQCVEFALANLKEPD